MISSSERIVKYRVFTLSHSDNTLKYNYINRKHTFMARKSVNFNVSEDTYNQVKSIFPDVVGTEDNLKQLLTAYQFWWDHKDDDPNAAAEKVKELQEKLDESNAALEQARDMIAHNGTQADEASKELEARIAELTEQLSTQEEQNMSLASVISERDATIAELQEKHPTWAQIRVTLQPFTVALLEETARRLSERYGKQVAPMAILTDMFLRYTIERWNEWFYKFILNDREILSIAQKINPDIKSIDQIKKAVLK